MSKPSKLATGESKPLVEVLGEIVLKAASKQLNPPAPKEPSEVKESSHRKRTKGKSDCSADPILRVIERLEKTKRKRR